MIRKISNLGSNNYYEKFYPTVFVLQSDGIIFMSKGKQSVTYQTVAEFQTDEPSFVPGDSSSINWEIQRDGNILRHSVLKSGEAVFLDESMDSIFSGYLDKISDYLDKQAARDLAEKNARPYTDKRAEQYSSMGDQLDQIIKTFKHLKTNGIDIGTDAEELISMSDAVKSEYPKL